MDTTDMGDLGENFKGEPGARPVGFVPQRPRRLKIISAAEIEPEAVSWFWKPYIPEGELTMIGGDPGARKSTLTRFLALAQAKGLPLPENQKLAPNRVLLLSVEDSPTKTSLPQWIAWGATMGDRERINIAPDPFTMDSEGMAMLEREVRLWKPKLVVIDPIVSFLGDQTDMNRQNQVRGILGPLAKMAQELNIAIVIVAHARKSGARKAMHALMGSVDFSAAVRSVLLVSLDPDDDDVSIVSHGKANLAKRGPSLRFSLDEANNFHWLGEDDRTADELTGAPKVAKERREKVQAMDLLRELLSNGPQLANVIKEHAGANEISARTLDRAKDALGIVSRQLKGAEEKAAFGIEPRVTAWIWEFPGGPSSPIHLESGNLAIWQTGPDN